MGIMALICVVYLFILLFCRADCVVGIDDMIMDFKFVWVTVLPTYNRTLILSSSYNAHYHPLPTVQRILYTVACFDYC